MKTSSARRVHSVLEIALNHPLRVPTPAIQVWARVFDIVPAASEGNLPAELEYEVLDALRDLRAEVAYVEEQVRGSEAAKPASQIAETVRAMTATNQLHNDWNHVRTNLLRPDLVGAWYWAALSQALAHTDSEIDPTKVDELRRDLERLEESARDQGLPLELRMLIDKQVRQIRSAIRKFSIRGVAPIQEVASSVIGDAVIGHAILVEAERSESAAARVAVSRLKTLWGALVRFAGDADKMEKLVKIVGGVIKALPGNHGGP